jgi:ribosome-associated protein
VNGTSESSCRNEAGVIKNSQQDEKSRSQVKRDIRELKNLGIQLAGLPKGQLRAIPLSDETREAMLATHGMARNALQRHYRYLSSLLAEEDVAAIRTALTGELQPHVKVVAKQHEAERLRDELLSGDERPLAAFVARYPECDRTHVRLLVRNARKELDLDKPPRSARLLFRYLRRLSDAQD